MFDKVNNKNLKYLLKTIYRTKNMNSKTLKKQAQETYNSADKAYIYRFAPFGIAVLAYCIWFAATTTKQELNGGNDIASSNL